MPDYFDYEPTKKKKKYKSYKKGFKRKYGQIQKL